MAWYQESKYCGKSYGGPWFEVGERFLGVEFKKNGKTHYGWARLSVGPFAIFLSGYAYETIAGKPIKAGQKKEAADDLPTRISIQTLPRPLLFQILRSPHRSACLLSVLKASL